MMETWISQRRDVILFLVIQVVMLVLFVVGTRYDDEADARTAEDKKTPGIVAQYYPMFQDVHVMIFVGFGFLMTFLKKYGYSSVGFNMLVAALMVQWAILCQGFWNLDPEDSKIHVSVTSLLTADLAAAAVLISMGAVLGKTTPLQLLIMGLLEIVVSTANEHLGVHVLKAVDAGASMYVHVFGAYFGLTVSLILGHGTKIRKGEGNAFEGASYTSDLFAMIGSVFLWMFWPSFNGAMVVGDDQHRAVINTYLSLASCCVTAFAVSALVSKENKFDMVHIQNATLAGGVAIGTAADMMVQPYGALAVGIIAGALSVFGYRYLQPFLLQHLRLHDTCGVNNLHGMPGILAGIIGALMAGVASEDTYLCSLYQQFPARSPPDNSSELIECQDLLPGLEPGDNRSASAQAGYQLLALLISFVLAIVSGAVTGLILRLPMIDRTPGDKWFTDEHHWELPEDNQQHHRPDEDASKQQTTEFYDSRIHI
ncbi:ammonium transporter Rh type B [Anabrus simplex]|uniref:ammonium transporter Rh type B n=1 Tax=Anabrus simplex TaxID=316456 RepID=UPI0035A36A63